MQQIGNFHKCGKRWICTAALNVGNMARIDVKPVCDKFLRDAEFISPFPYVCANCPEI
jgi:hypothetical protein